MDPAIQNCATTPASVCPNCGGTLNEDEGYCAGCGQRVSVADDRRLWPLLKSSFEDALSLDGRVWRSLWSLLARPGFLTREHQLGRRRRYLSPISLFLLANLVFFLAPSLSDFSVSLFDQTNLQPYSSLIAGQAQRAIDSSGEERATFAARYQSQADDIAEIMVIVHVPLLALASFLFAFGMRSYYADHVVLVLHLFAFLMIYYALMPYTLLPLLRGLDAFSGGAIPGWGLATALQFLYIPIMLRVAFGMGWLRLLITVPAFVLALFWVHVAYRFAQFELALALLAM